MSRAKRRSEILAPALFPFMAVLLCLIGALVLILALTVTNSHASARREAELALLEAKEKVNLAQTVSEELQSQREEMKKLVEARRRQLQDIEDHIKRLHEELESLQHRWKVLEEKKDSSETAIEQKKMEASKLQSEIDAKKRELAEEIEKQKKKKPAFAILPYSGKNGTTRRPIYIECTSRGLILQPEGISIANRDLIPPGPGNPLSTALRMMRQAYSNADAAYGISQSPYPLLLVRPDGIESYARAREAMSDWDDQFGYELIDRDMELSFPPGVPGLKESVTEAVAAAKQRQAALLAANPRLIRQYELSQPSWEEESSMSSSSLDPKFGSSGVGSQGLNPGTNSGNWSMVRPVEGAFAGNGVAPGTSSMMNGSQLASETGEPLQDSASTRNPRSATAADSATNGLSSGAVGDANALGNDAGLSDGNQGFESAGSNTNRDSALSGRGPLGNAATGSETPGGNLGGGSSQSTHSNSASGSGSSGGAGAISGASATPAVDPENPPNVPNISMNIQSSENARHVRPEGDLKPIAVGAGRNWAQAKVEGKASPVRRNIQIVAINTKWFIRSDNDPNKLFDTIIILDQKPQQISEELARAIRARVESWGTPGPGMYWVPLVVIEAASDAGTSVARLEKLLEGSGVDLTVVPLRISK